MLTLDGKGRITVPSRWRELIDTNFQGHLVVTKSPDGCLSLYPLPVWEQFETALMNLPQEDEAWRRFFVGSATELEIDSASRVLIPPELREWAGLEKDVKFMGVGTHFELWDAARHQAREAEALAKGRPEALRQLVLR